MKLVHSTLALAVLATGTAQAQFAEPAPGFFGQLGKTEVPFEKPWQPRARSYARNMAENPNDRLYKGMFKTDPRLLFGVELAPKWTLEAGYVNSFDRGFHRMDERDPGDTAGALGANGASTHAAVRYDLPINDQLSAYGKVGIGHSETTRGGRKAETGVYTGVGARLNVDDRTTIKGEYGSHGGGLKSFGNSNANGIKADLGIRF